MSPAQTAVTRPVMVRRKNLRPCLRAWWFHLAAIFFLTPLYTSAQVSITISPSAVNLTPNGTQQFTATVTGAADTTVTWTIQEGALGGTLSDSGLYTAPAALGLYHVIATSNADNTQSATATIALPGFVTWGLNTPREFATRRFCQTGRYFSLAASAQAAPRPAPRSMIRPSTGPRIRQGCSSPGASTQLRFSRTAKYCWPAADKWRRNSHSGVVRSCGQYIHCHRKHDFSSRAANGDAAFQRKGSHHRRGKLPHHVHCQQHGRTL